MKRIFTIFVAALVMVALLAFMAAPAFSACLGSSGKCGQAAKKAGVKKSNPTQFPPGNPEQGPDSKR